MLPADNRARRIEEASLRAWPALSDSDFDGWRLRFADGYTRRANSITPLGTSRLSVEDKIATCERLYAERGLPAIFRLTPFAPPELDDVLARRGYRIGDRVQVRARPFGAPIVGPGTPPAPVGVLRIHRVDPWLDIFGSLSSAPATNRPAHKAVLNAIPGSHRLVALWADGQAVACGLSVLTDGLLGLFDLVTATDQRNRGYGSEMLRRSLRWGSRSGAEEAYLQVLDRNKPARHIYERAGFEVVYEYHYRQPG